VRAGLAAARVDLTAAEPGPADVRAAMDSARLAAGRERVEDFGLGLLAWLGFAVRAGVFTVG
jgi:hypothetical protein